MTMLLKRLHKKSQQKKHRRSFKPLTREHIWSRRYIFKLYIWKKVKSSPNEEEESSHNNYSRRKLIRSTKKVITIIEANEGEVVMEIEEEDKVMDKEKDEVGGLMTTTTTSKEVMGKATEDRGITSQMWNVTIVRSLIIMLLNLELLATIELKRRQTMLKKSIKKVTHDWWFAWVKREVKTIDGT